MSDTCFLRIAVLLAPLVALPGAGAAESSLVLDYPRAFGKIPAKTYDDTGKAVGDAWIEVTRLEDGKVRISGQSGMGIARTQVFADLAPVNGDAAGGLRPVFQSSNSFDAEGQSLGTLAIDHEKGEASCTMPPKNGKPPDTERIELPEEDRLANIPLNLLFQPLARGERERLDFQIMLCSGGPRIVNAKATVVDRKGKSPGGVRKLVQIRYELSLPRLLAAIASRFLPQLSFWFDSNGSGDWVAHQMPLYSKGPTVLIVRSGVTPSDLQGL